MLLQLYESQLQHQKLLGIRMGSMDCMRGELNAKATTCDGSSSLQKVQSRLLSKSASLIQE
jgi:hypothetical protein